MGNINIMSDDLINKIAAGEIIDRPLSIVKELVENSLDANATEIIIKLKDSGVLSIEISDNGDGIKKEDMLYTIKRHATSKLYDEKDLFNIATLGFRGEALASISVVSKLSIFSSCDGINGYTLSYPDYNEVIDKSCNKGTLIKVEDLFYNTPVRFKYLSSLNYELSLIINFINKIALLNSNVRFVLINNEKELFKSSGNGKVIDVLTTIYGKEIGKKIEHVYNTNDDFKVNLYIGSPEYTRASKSNVIISVNNRVILNRKIEDAIIKGYADYLHTNQYPVIVVMIEVDYALVDVNIHPTKQQVKISLIDKLEDLLIEAISNSLRKVAYVPDVVLRKVNEEENTYTFDTNNIDNQEINFKKEQIGLDVKDEINWKLPNFDYIGSLHDSFLLFQNMDGLFLLDQHAAQERINYEKILNKFKNKKFYFQNLLYPLSIKLKSDEVILLRDKFNLLNDVGIKLEEFGINTFRVVEIDDFYLKSGNLSYDINNMIKLLIKDDTVEFDKLYNDLAIMMACKSSITANFYVNSIEVNNLLIDLNNCESPYTCPHGRPIIINITTKEIDKLFKRTF